MNPRDFQRRYYSFDSGLGFQTAPMREAGEKDKRVAVATMEEVKKMARPVETQAEPKRENAALLKELGFTKVSKKAEEFANLRMKENMAILAGYTKISWAEFEAANKVLKERTERTMELNLTEVKDYEGVPPVAVLAEMKKAVQAGVFDKFSIISVKQVPDPILVGQLKDSKDMFFIAEWGEDISLQDLVA